MGRGAFFEDKIHMIHDTENCDLTHDSGIRDLTLDSENCDLKHDKLEKNDRISK